MEMIMEAKGAQKDRPPAWLNDNQLEIWQRFLDDHDELVGSTRWGKICNIFKNWAKKRDINVRQKQGRFVCSVNRGGNSINEQEQDFITAGDQIDRASDILDTMGTQVAANAKWDEEMIRALRDALVKLEDAMRAINSDELAEKFVDIARDLGRVN